MSSQENLIVMIKVSDKEYREISQYIDDLKRRLFEKSVSFSEFKKATGTLIGHTKTRNLEIQGELIIPKTQILKAKVFKHRAGGNNQQYHSKNFEDILLANASSILKSSEIKINEYKLLKAQNDYKNCDELGGEKAIAVLAYDEVLIILHHIMQNRKYRDDNDNIVYFMYNDVLHCTDCGRDGGDWYFTVRPACSHDLDVGTRVLSFAELKLVV